MYICIIVPSSRYRNKEILIAFWNENEVMSVGFLKGFFYLKIFINMEMYNLKETKKYFIDISNLEARPMSNSIFLEEGKKLRWEKEGCGHVIFLCVKKTRNDVLNQEFYFFVEVN